MDWCTARTIRLESDRIQKALGSYFDFSFLFPVILTDKSSKFGKPDHLKKDRNGNRTSLFYCDPMQSSQKTGIENVHTMLRIIIPSGTILEGYIQWDIRRVIDHVNNTPHKNRDGRTPDEIAIKTFVPEVLYVAPDEVTLSPKLLK